MVLASWDYYGIQSYNGLLILTGLVLGLVWFLFLTGSTVRQWKFFRMVWKFLLTIGYVIFLIKGQEFLFFFLFYTFFHFVPLSPFITPCCPRRPPGAHFGWCRDDIQIAINDDTSNPPPPPIPPQPLPSTLHFRFPSPPKNHQQLHLFKSWRKGPNSKNKNITSNTVMTTPPRTTATLKATITLPLYFKYGNHKPLCFTN